MMILEYIMLAVLVYMILNTFGSIFFVIIFWDLIRKDKERISLFFKTPFAFWFYVFIPFFVDIDKYISSEK